MKDISEKHVNINAVMTVFSHKPYEFQVVGIVANHHTGHSIVTGHP